jgi:hypothetical protein
MLGLERHDLFTEGIRRRMHARELARQSGLRRLFGGAHLAEGELVSGLEHCRVDLRRSGRRRASAHDEHASDEAEDDADDEADEQGEWVHADSVAGTTDVVGAQRRGARARERDG